MLLRYSKIRAKDFLTFIKLETWIGQGNRVGTGTGNELSPFKTKGNNYFLILLSLRDQLLFHLKFNIKLIDVNFKSAANWAVLFSNIN